MIMVASAVRVGDRFLGIVAALVAGLAWGVFNGFLIAKAKVPPLIVTLGSLSGALGLAQIITKGVDIRDAPACWSRHRLRQHLRPACRRSA